MRIVRIHRQDPITSAGARDGGAKSGIERPVEAAVAIVPHDFDAHRRVAFPFGGAGGVVAAAVVDHDDPQRFTELGRALAHALQQPWQRFGFVVGRQRDDDHAFARIHDGCRRRSHASIGRASRAAAKIAMSMNMASSIRYP